MGGVECGVRKREWIDEGVGGLCFFSQCYIFLVLVSVYHCSYID